MNYNDYLNKQAEKIAQICKEGATTQEIESKISNGLQGSFIMSQIREEITHAITNRFLSPSPTSSFPMNGASPNPLS